MADWKVVHKSNIISFEEVFTLGLVSAPDTYTVEDESGNQRTVTAWTEEQVGEKISKGDFDD